MFSSIFDEYSHYLNKMSALPPLLVELLWALHLWQQGPGNKSVQNRSWRACCGGQPHLLSYLCPHCRGKGGVDEQHQVSFSLKSMCVTCFFPQIQHGDFQLTFWRCPLHLCSQSCHQQGPFLRDAGSQEEEGIVHEEALEVLVTPNVALDIVGESKYLPCLGQCRGHVSGLPQSSRDFL